MDTPSFVRKPVSTDAVETSLRSISQYVATITFGFLPLLFIPIAFMPLDYGKVIIALSATVLAIMFAALANLRSGSITIAAPWALLGLWLVAGIGVLAAIFSGDVTDAMVGDLFEVNSAIFLLLLALVASVTTLVQFTKVSIMRLYMFLTVSAGVLSLYHVSRLVFGPEFLSLGLFTGQVSTAIGSWNDLGLFFGLSILLCMVALEQLPLTRSGRITFTVGIVFSLLMLMVINFSAVWWVLGIVSLVMLMYGLVRDRFAEPTLGLEQSSASNSLQSILTSLAVFIVSLVFILAGGPLGGVVSQITGVSHLEVRPSFTATTEIARSVYSENAFFGIGPNKFVDAWRLYKNPAINQTIFWDTDFRGGNGYITSHLVTTGILGTLAWLLFLGLFIYAGFRMLFKTVHADRFWYFIGSSAFVGALYLWGMSLVYLPGATILIIAALFTAIMFAAYVEIVGAPSFVLNAQGNKRMAVVLVGVVMVIVIASASVLYYVGRHYSAVYTYAQAISSAIPGVTTLTDVELQIARAFELYPNDTYARQVANYQLAKIDALLALTEPTPEEQQEFQAAVVNGVNSAQRAVELDPTDAINWAILGRVYSVLVAAGETEVIQRAEEAFATARELAPQNPQLPLLQAQLQVRAQNIERARELVGEAIALKPNFTEALNFLTQIEVAEGRTEEAIAATRSIINIEPNNPARYYQLAILLSASGDLPGSTAALERAVALNTNYANARYLLALAYAQAERTDDALEQLRVVLELNPDNQAVLSLISQLESGEFTPTATPAGSVNEPATVSSSDTEVTATEAPDTSLISPVNAVPESNDTPAEEVAEDAAVAEDSAETTEE